MTDQVLLALPPAGWVGCLLVAGALAIWSRDSRRRRRAWRLLRMLTRTPRNAS
ncbi:hypothetical protein [Actinocatenispora sera]|uniref:hypothetical protein n=1 Tax=Actinocatenispora sera TaxID=390989 RepID=UPI0012ED0D11|nr:hypothetical protein [Actinocatenispora sera]